MRILQPASQPLHEQVLSKRILDVCKRAYFRKHVMTPQIIGRSEN